MKKTWCDQLHVCCGIGQYDSALNCVYRKLFTSGHEYVIMISVFHDHLLCMTNFKIKKLYIKTINSLNQLFWHWKIYPTMACIKANQMLHVRTHSRDTFVRSLCSAWIQWRSCTVTFPNSYTSGLWPSLLTPTAGTSNVGLQQYPSYTIYHSITADCTRTFIYYRYVEKNLQQRI